MEWNLSLFHWSTAKLYCKKVLLTENRKSWSVLPKEACIKHNAHLASWNVCQLIKLNYPSLRSPQIFLQPEQPYSILWDSLKEGSGYVRAAKINLWQEGKTWLDGGSRIGTGTSGMRVYERRQLLSHDSIPVLGNCWRWKKEDSDPQPQFKWRPNSSKRLSIILSCLGHYQRKNNCQTVWLLYDCPLRGMIWPSYQKYIS